jgi:broad specificity phosphatase PhoE
MKKITIIRHAESKFNARQYETDNELRNCRLSENGKLQAQNLQQSFDIIILSPLKRALETYVESNLKSRKIIISDLFRGQKEISQLSYLENEEIKPENLDDVRKRAREAIAFLKSLEYDNIGIISHGQFISHFLEQCGQYSKSIHNTESISFEL